MERTKRSVVYVTLHFLLFIIANGFHRQFASTAASHNEENLSSNDWKKLRSSYMKLVDDMECPERYSCSQNKSYTPLTHRDILNLNCHCDDLCQIYDDCCEDVFHRSRDPVNDTLHQEPDEMSNKQQIKIPLEVIACESLEFEYDLVSSVYVVTRCPEWYKEDYVRDKCNVLGSSFPLTELFYRVPVTGRNSRILYRNYYCAICNGDDDLLFWKAEVSSRYMGQPLNISSFRELTSSKVRVRFIHPDGFQPRPCKAVIRKCSKDWVDRDIAFMCEQRFHLTAYVYSYGEYSQGRVFRNKHCALCNYVNDTRAGCRNYSGILASGFPGSMPFSIIFDISTTNGKLFSRDNFGAANHIELQKCSSEMVYDPFADMCRLVFCQKGYRLTANGCLESDELHMSSVSKTGFDGNQSSYNFIPNCSQTIRFNESEYEFFSNSSVLIFQTGFLYDPGDYFLSNSYIFICADTFGRSYNTTVYADTLLPFDVAVQSILTAIGLAVSLIALVIQFTVYMLFPVLRNTPGKCVMCLVVSVFFGELTFFFVDFSNNPICFYSAAVMHFAFLASFFWMNVLAFDICRTFSSQMVAYSSSTGSGSKRFLFYSVYAWSSTGAIVMTCVIMDVLQLGDIFRPDYGKPLCWLNNQLALIIFFLVPIAILLASNIVLFAITVYSIRECSNESHMAVKKKHTKDQFILCIKLSCIMGFTWILGFIAILTKRSVFWYLFTVFNSLQGAFLCLVFIFTKNVFRLFKARFFRCSGAAETSSSRFSTESTKV